MKSRIAIAATMFSIVLISLSAVANGRADDFYKGKTIRFVVGAPAGGGYDTYARAIGRLLGNHIPGNPSMVVDNMDGAGSLIAANYVYNKAERDGLTIGVWISGQIIRQALGDRGPRFDGRKFGWIGAPSKGSPTCAIMGFTGMKTKTSGLTRGNVGFRSAGTGGHSRGHAGCGEDDDGPGVHGV